MKMEPPQVAPFSFCTPIVFCLALPSRFRGRKNKKTLLGLANISFGLRFESMKNIEVYWGSGSTPAWRVLLGLNIKGIPFESKLLSFQKGEHKSPEQLAMNARGRVPVMKHGDFTLYESVAILAYLDRAFEQGPKLFGETAEETGIIWKETMEFLSYLEPAARTAVRAVFFNSIDEQKSQLEADRELIIKELKILNDKLLSQPFFAGSTLSAADIIIYPQLAAFVRASTKPRFEELGFSCFPLEEKLPKIHAWMQSIEALPCYDSTYPPHWREG